MTHVHVDGVSIGQHPLVTRLLKGVYNQRPPKPRYTSTWDVDIVLNHMTSLGENTDLTLKQLSQKLVMLMALVQASRTSELQALDLRFRVFRQEGVSFKLPTLTKKRSAGAPPREVFFAGFSPEKRLCVVECLREYERRTQAFRPKAVSESQKLFLSYVRPHKPVSSQRIAHWIKDFLREARIDTGVFKAHSVRGASSTAALDKGASIQDVLQTADWSSDSTFRRFYYRPAANTTYAQRVLQKRNQEVCERFRALSLYE